MHPGPRRKVLWLIVAAGFAGGAAVAAARTQPTPAVAATVNPASSMIQEMVGTWDVQQRMWPAAGAKAIELPSAVASRKLIGNAILDEVMTLAPGSTQEAFTRVAYFNYNTVNRQYEYFSLDTRAPQMMNEKSSAATRRNAREDVIRLQGGRFVAPQWGEARDVAFSYRLEVGKIENNRQLVRLYLTPQSGKIAREFLAFEYVYTRRR